MISTTQMNTMTILPMMNTCMIITTHMSTMTILPMMNTCMIITTHMSIMKLSNWSTVDELPFTSIIITTGMTHYVAKTFKSQ